MSERNWLERLEDMLERIIAAQSILKNIDYESFLKDGLKIAAVERHLEIIGEITRHVPNDVKSSYSQIPWQDMYGMRNILAHGYDVISTDTLWVTVKEKLPELESAVVKIREDHEKS